ncbi:MAG: 2OG-Fe(II) oxygenase [Spongiibacteraceae bacterium]|jgi:SM-20-related protein|nr:2OG-Fe(II) oxygenase [Spongiibacteraceae bacterium]
MINSPARLDTALLPLAPVDQLVEDVARQGWAVAPDWLPINLAVNLAQEVRALEAWRSAAVGRGAAERRDLHIRSDQIHWLDGVSPAQHGFLGLMEHLRLAFNRALFLGLFDFESHFARYPVGARYRRHVDAFRGRGNRRLSVVCYLNPEWPADGGGELVIHAPEAPRPVLPQLGTIACFLSESTVHEVLPARMMRYSLTGWFRINASTHGRVDPDR